MSRQCLVIGKSCSLDCWLAPSAQCLASCTAGVARGCSRLGLVAITEATVDAASGSGMGKLWDCHILPGVSVPIGLDGSGPARIACWFVHTQSASAVVVVNGLPAVSRDIRIADAGLFAVGVASRGQPVLDLLPLAGLSREQHVACDSSDLHGSRIVLQDWAPRAGATDLGSSGIADLSAAGSRHEPAPSVATVAWRGCFGCLAHVS